MGNLKNSPETTLRPSKSKDSRDRYSWKAFEHFNETVAVLTFRTYILIKTGRVIHAREVNETKGFWWEGKPLLIVHVHAPLCRKSSSSSSTTAPPSGTRLSFHSRSTSRRKRKSMLFYTFPLRFLCVWLSITLTFSKGFKGHPPYPEAL